MKLNRLYIENFKGVRKLEVTMNGKNIVAYGKNATGKTTIADAYNFCLFGKDSQGKKDFDIKTQENGEVLHGLEHIVELEFTEPSIKFKVVYSEVWKKERGASEKVFSGHTTDYFVNDVPTKKGEYEKEVAGIIKEDAFKLLSNPLFFNQLAWKDRRKILFEVCGDVADADVISSNEELMKLAEFVGKNSIEDHKKIIAAKLKKINEELEKIPIRIAENQKLIGDVGNLDIDDLKAALNVLQHRRKEKADELAQIQSGGQAAVVKKQLDEVEAQMRKVKGAFEQGKADARIQLQKSYADATRKVSDKKVEVLECEASIGAMMRLIASRTSETAKLRDRFITDSAIEWAGDCTCPTCQQELPEHQVAEARASFNVRKSSILEKINDEGKSLKEEISKLEADIVFKNSKFKSLQVELVTVEEQKQHINGALGEPQMKIEDQIDYVLLLAKHAEISAIEPDTDTTVIDTVKTAIVSLDSEITGINASVATVEASAKVNARIEELKADAGRLSDEHREASRQNYLIEEFTKTKCNMVEEQINSKFKRTRFRLFNIQINGGVDECCDSLGYSAERNAWVAWDSALNSGERIQVGVDIINTLSRHYRISLPIFCDNAESVTEAIEADGQLVRLVAVVGEDKLRVVVGDDAKLEPFNIELVSGKDWNEAAKFEIKVNGKTKVSAQCLSECPEDAMLERDLNFVYSIPDLMQEAYQAGRSGKKLVISQGHADEE